MTRRPRAAIHGVLIDLLAKRKVFLGADSLGLNLHLSQQHTPLTSASLAENLATSYFPMLLYSEEACQIHLRIRRKLMSKRP